MFSTLFIAFVSFAVTQAAPVADVEARQLVSVGGGGATVAPIVVGNPLPSCILPPLPSISLPPLPTISLPPLPSISLPPLPSVSIPSFTISLPPTATGIPGNPGVNPQILANLIATINRILPQILALPDGILRTALGNALLTAVNAQIGLSTAAVTALQNQLAVLLNAAGGGADLTVQQFGQALARLILQTFAVIDGAYDGAINTAGGLQAAVNQTGTQLTALVRALFAAIPGLRAVVQPILESEVDGEVNVTVRAALNAILGANA